MKKLFGLILLILAYGLLYPGLTQPILSISGTVEKADLALLGKDIIVNNPDTPELVGSMAEIIINKMELSGSVEVYQKTRSIFGTVSELFESNHKLVAFLVALFSIIIPLLKGLILLFSHFQISPRLSQSLRGLSNGMSKWSMADVFVIGIFVAFLAANAIKKEGGILSFDAQFETGFYFFLGYCLLSIIGTQILLSSGSKPTQTAEKTT